MLFKCLFVTLTLTSLVSLTLISLYQFKCQMKTYHPTKIDLSYSWTLNQRNHLRFQRLINQYASLINISAFESNIASSKTFIYSCRSFCGGWGDRLRGIFSAYFLALVSNRHFLIDMSYPCDIHQVLQPNRVNWSFWTNFTRKNRTRLTINTMASWRQDYRNEINDIIKTKDFVKIWSSYDDILITTNSDYLSVILHNRHYSAQLKNFFGQLKSSEISIQRLFPFFFDYLFQPSISVRQRVDVILGAAIDRSLICLHIRLGKNPSNPFDYAFQRRENTSRLMMKYIEQQYLRNRSDALIFVTSDSSQAIADVLSHYPTSAMTIVGPLLHIDRFDRRTSGLIDGFKKVFADFYLLGECDVLLASRSGFSFWANRRRTNLTSNYLIFNENSQRFSS